jgi:CRISPR-associated endonuclease Csn1
MIKRTLLFSHAAYLSTKNEKYVEAAKGTNLFFAIYWNAKKKKREYETIPLNVVIEHQKQVAHLPKDQRTAVRTNAEKGRASFHSFLKRFGLCTNG